MKNKKGKKEMRPKKRPKVREYSVRHLFIMMVIISAIFTVQGIHVHSENEYYKQKKEHLNLMINKEEQRRKQLKEQKKYMNTDEYIKDIAKSELGMIEDGDIVFKQDIEKSK